MKCPNPACPSNKYTAKRIRKQRQQDKTQPEAIHVVLRCAHCGREVKVWISNEDLRKIHAELRLIKECQNSQESVLKEILEQLKSKNWFERILERILKRD